jgi:lipopolysaccharide/colanic/teichoic acid biosynthesis glycosyltransferase
LKRILDLVLTLATAPLWLPLMMVVVVLVAFRLGRPVFFRQVRAGRYGRPFSMVKFRTMREAFDARGEPLPDAERLTPFGRWLRSTSLDELPELFNVLGGSMSLVGPRPLLPEYDAHYSSRQRRRLEVAPGITGWAQVQGRNALGWPERFELDVWYVDNRSAWLDLRILCLTVLRVIKRDGITPVGQETMPPFRGEHADGG